MKEKYGWITKISKFSLSLQNVNKTLSRPCLHFWSSEETDRIAFQLMNMQTGRCFRKSNMYFSTIKGSRGVSNYGYVNVIHSEQPLPKAWFAILSLYFRWFWQNIETLKTFFLQKMYNMLKQMQYSNEIGLKWTGKWKESDVLQSPFFATIFVTSRAHGKSVVQYMH